MGLRLAPNLELPVDYVTKTVGILAQRRKGKTYTANVIAEEFVAAGLPFVALDPTGAWWGLRASSDGAGPGLPVTILGGEHGDVPINRTDGKGVAELVVDEPGWYVIDFSLFESNAAEVQFATDFAQQLYRRKGQPNSDFPMHLFVDEADRFCMTADTEVLTDHGWARWDEVRVGTEIVGFDLATEQYRYEPVQAVLHRMHDGEMVGMKTKGLDCLVTPDHRVVLRRSQRGGGGRPFKFYDWAFCPAGDVPTNIAIPLGGAPSGEGIDELDPELLRILGWVITDGFWHDRRKSTTLALQQSVTTTKRGVPMADEMAMVLDRLPGVSRYIRPSRVTRAPQGEVTGAPSYQWYFGAALSARLTKWLGDEIHRIPRRILDDASKEQLGSLYQGLMEGDGTSTGAAWVKFYPGRNEALADDFQELALKLGVSTTKMFVPSNNQWHVSITERSTMHWVRKPYRTTYRGLVWDITVPSGAFVARRNGRIFVTGNCPQQPAREKGEGSETTMLGAFEAIVRRGGLRGLGTTLISQRSAVVNKNVLEQVDVLIVLRTVGPNDRGRVIDIVSAEGTPEQIAGIKTSMASLDLGEAWFWEPGEGLFQRIRVRERRTFNSSATPKPGEKRVEPRRLASVDLEAIKERWADTIERAKADDPKLLRARIMELERHLRDAQKAAPAPEQIEVRVEVPVVHVPSLGALDEIMSSAMQTYVHAENLHKIVSELRAEPVASSGRNDTRRQESKPAVPARRPSPRVAGPAAARGVQPSVPTGEGDLTGPMRKLLTVLATYGPRTKRQLALLAGYSIGGGAFNNPLGRIRSLGFVDPPKGEPMAITDAGLSALGAYDPLPQGPDLLDHWLASLPGPARKLLSALADRWPDSYTREELAEVTGYEPRGGAFNNPLGKLRTLELVARGADIRLTDDFGEAIS